MMPLVPAQSDVIVEPFRFMSYKPTAKLILEIFLFTFTTFIFTARYIYIARTMLSQDVCLAVRPSHADIVSKR